VQAVSTATSGVRHAILAIAEGMLVAAIVGALIVGMAIMSGNAPGGAGSVLAGRCVRNTPSVSVENSYGWGQWGSWGLAGQKLPYQISVTNNDVGCRAASFAISLNGPDSFAISLPTTKISVKSTSQAYLSESVTSPASAGNGDYELVATATRADGSDPAAPFTSTYRVYSSDNEAPTLFWPNPSDGQTISGRSYTFVASSRDDHDVKSMSLSIDGNAVSSTTCDNVDYTCTLSFPTSVGSGDHTATFRARDWMDNVGTVTVTFTAK
jgi:hypothetical protein